MEYNMFESHDFLLQYRKVGPLYVSHPGITYLVHVCYGPKRLMQEQ